MITSSDLLYIVIPLTNSVGNVLLKLSISHKKNNNYSRFIVMQLAGYTTFIIVMALSYIFLLTHDASFFVLLFSLNYLVTLYASRWFLNEHYTSRDVIYDGLMVIGICIFYWGQSH